MQSFQLGYKEALQDFLIGKKSVGSRSGLAV